MTAPLRSLSRLDAVLSSLVDEDVGIIKGVRELSREAGAPNFFHYAASACDVQAFGKPTNFRYGGGASADRGRALAKAIGEAVERYCAAFYEIEELPLASYARASFPCVPPGAFALSGPEQFEQPGFPFVPFRDDTLVRWAEAVDAGTGEACHVPAILVFVPYHCQPGTGESPIAQAISTGLACHCSPEEAAISAICEVIERDAFTITWQAQLSRPRIPVETLSVANQDLVARFARAGYLVTLLDITMDLGVPTVLAVARHSSPEAPALVVAASAALDPEEAVRKSLEELAHTGRYSQSLKSSRQRRDRERPPITPRAQEAHLNFWCDQANAPLADFLCAGTERTPFGDLVDLGTVAAGQNLKILVDRVRAVGQRVLVREVTTADVAGLGLAVVRAVIPGFHPLVIGHSLRALGGSRLWEVPQKLGYPGITRARGDNPYPHPFP